MEERVTERPILFQSEMVRAILREAGETPKTATRRIIKPQPKYAQTLRSGTHETSQDGGFDCDVRDIRCPYGEPGDRLWGRETWAVRESSQSFRGQMFKPPGSVLYRATEPYFDGPWKPSIFMPRWASRITLEVTMVRAERVQDISEDDARAEGVALPLVVERLREQPTYRTCFRDLWNRINGLPRPQKTDGAFTHYTSYPWEGEAGTVEHRGLPHHVHPNPWVFAVDFKRIEPGAQP